MAADPRADVVLGGRVLAAHGHADLVWGHVSVRDPDGRGAWLKRPGLGFEEVATDDVQLVDLDGEVLEGEGAPHLERYIHTEILKVRPDVGSVVHAHPEAAVVFASLGIPLEPIAHEGTLFGPPDIARFTCTGELISSPVLGAAVAEALADRNALLLVNHGVVVVGADVGDAVFTAVMLEKACRMHLAALTASGGRPLLVSSPEEALRKRATCYSATQRHHGWEHLTRTL